jgi:hypothetical protein
MRHNSRLLVTFAALLVPVLSGSSSDYLSAKRKFDLIEKEQVKPGSHVLLTPGELNAYVAQEVTTVVPDGVRSPKLELGTGSASASALIDFAKVRRAQGKPPGWLMSKLLSGERPVNVSARIDSGAGRATVHVQRVEISGIAIEGGMLDFLIRNYLLPVYPNAKVEKPFDLGHRIERLDVKPAAVGVVIGR